MLFWMPWRRRQCWRRALRLMSLQREVCQSGGLSMGDLDGGYPGCSLGTSSGGAIRALMAPPLE
eukprot:4843489-Prorocentrum_lima.AAC.1